MLVFYDTETTGTSIEYDQILQFGAILTDDALKEIDRFEIRCRLLPWVVPSPMALLVTGVDLDLLTDQTLPTFYEMMVEVRERLLRWAPAMFIGYNSIRFDEPMLQRAFWQTLLPPYMTVTNGNARLDILPFVRAVAHLQPGTIKVPTDKEGKSSFRLDNLAPLNGFDAHRAHDALGDVEATLFMARLLSDRAPVLWQLHQSRSSKAAASSVLTFGRPVLVVQSFGEKPLTWFGQRVDREDKRASHAVVAILGDDWLRAEIGARDSGSSGSTKASGRVRRIALNKAPIVFTTEEAHSLFGLTPSSDELSASRTLASNENLCAEIAHLSIEASYPTGGGELEETIFNSFPSKVDEGLMKRFQRGEWPERLEIAKSFEDERFRQLAMRIVFHSAPSLMAAEERTRLKEGIARRITASGSDVHSWRSIPDAITELDHMPRDQWGAERLAKVGSWLLRRRESVLS